MTLAFPRAVGTQVALRDDQVQDPWTGICNGCSIPGYTWSVLEEPGTVAVFRVGLTAPQAVDGGAEPSGTAHTFRPFFPTQGKPLDCTTRLTPH